MPGNLKLGQGSDRKPTPPPVPATPTSGTRPAPPLPPRPLPAPDDFEPLPADDGAVRQKVLIGGVILLFGVVAVLAMLGYGREPSAQWVVGAAISGWTAVIGYWIGSSAGSQAKDGTIKAAVAATATGAAAAPVAAKVDVSAAMQLLTQKWKSGGGASGGGGGADTLKPGQVRNFRIVSIDPIQKKIEVEVAQTAAAS